MLRSQKTNTDFTKEEELEPGRQRSHIDSVAQLKFAVVSFAENRGVEDVLLQPREFARRSSEVSLRIVRETRGSPYVLVQ